MGWKMCFTIKSHTWERWEEIKNTRKIQNEKDDRKEKKNNFLNISIDFNSTNFYIEIKMFTMDVIQILVMNNRMIDFEKSPIYQFLVSLITKIKKTSLFVCFSCWYLPNHDDINIDFCLNFLWQNCPIFNNSLNIKY
jgi:hypothetical protein